MTRLAGKVFVFSPPKKENNCCTILKDEEIMNLIDEIANEIGFY